MPKLGMVYTCKCRFGRSKNITAFENLLGILVMNPKMILYTCLLALCLSGCAPRLYLNPSSPYATKEAQGSLAWHQIRFKWRWPKGQQPDWSLDLLAADRVFAGVIERYQQSLPLWRFHRRAARDAAGDQFSFLFYSSDGTARKVEDMVTGHPVTRALEDRGLLERVYVTRPRHARKLSATSDHHWPEDLQQAWPMYIMGVSQTWLALVELHTRNTKIATEDIDKELKYYSHVNDEINKVWVEYAQHAFLHHLSAVFGYEPMVIRDYIQF